jgi:CIC family chloride channel protein
VRSRESGLSLIALAIGLTSGFLVAAVSASVQFMHAVLFRLAYSESLSSANHIDWYRLLLVPTCGGLVLSVVSGFLIARLRAPLMDVIEANALYGGRLSVRGSALITLQTIISNGFGASVGLEAGYTQICAAVASWVGQWLGVRRGDMRMLVGAGAAGAIAAAFGAPLAGAFYAFEVVLGSYSVGALAPVAISAVAASAVAHRLSPHSFVIGPSFIGAVESSAVFHVTAIALLCSLVSVVLMKAVSLVEALLARSSVPTEFRPIVGGLVVGLLALLSPQVLGAGHGAMHFDLAVPVSTGIVALLILLKVSAAAVSLGSGFRGGLFFASLLLGTLVGSLYADISALITARQTIDTSVAALAGMAALGTGILGAPVTMTALALETTGDFSITVAALIAATIASLILRETFGYSFATWRFHLRGEAIRGPHDVGWIRDLTVSKLMRRDLPTMPGDRSLGEAKRLFPLGATKQFAIVDSYQKYEGLVSTAELFGSVTDQLEPIRVLGRYQDQYLTPEMNIRNAIDAFTVSEADALAVLDSASSHQVIGVLTEAYVLRRYGQELECRYRAETMAYTRRDRTRVPSPRGGFLDVDTEQGIER